MRLVILVRPIEAKSVQEIDILCNVVLFSSFLNVLDGASHYGVSPNVNESTISLPSSLGQRSVILRKFELGTRLI